MFRGQQHQSHAPVRRTGQQPVPSNTMHRVFFNMDIVREIMATSTRGTLVSVGLTCKALYDPAMDRVWDTLDSLMPLLECFPRDVIHESMWEDGLCTDPRPPNQAADWTRFKLYAARIRGLHLTGHDSTSDDYDYFGLSPLERITIPSRHSEIIEKAQFALPGEKQLYLIPKLSSLSLLGDWEAAEFSLLLHALASPTLLRLNINLPSGALNTLSALMHLRLSCPGLECLSIGNLNKDPTRIVSQFHALRSLQYKTNVRSPRTELHPTSFQQLGGLENLRKLDIGASFRPEGTLRYIDTLDTDTPVRFVALQDVSIGGVADLRHLAAFLRRHTNISLRRLVVSYPSFGSTRQGLLREPGPPPGDIRVEMFDALADALSLHPSLDALEITGAAVTKPYGGDPSYRLILSLSKLTCLREVVLVNALDIVSNDSIASLVQHWPRLEVFTFSMTGWESGCATPQSQLTPAVLSVFSTHCPHLKALSLAFNLADMTSLQSDGDPSHQRWAPLVLNILGDTKIQNTDSAMILARYIWYIYPNVTFRAGAVRNPTQHYMHVFPDRSVDQRGRFAHPMPGYWETVQSAIKLFSGIL